MSSPVTLRTKKEIFQQVLTQLGRDVPDIYASVLVRQDGLLITSNLPNDVDGRKVAAISAAIATIGIRAVNELKQGKINQIIVTADEGQIITMGIENLFISVLVSKEANLGYALLELENVAGELKEILGGQ
jgi:predicted regulator of Ras-like GTPase activity (Roadblock/LC7/MglB family)